MRDKICVLISLLIQMLEAIVAWLKRAPESAEEQAFVANQIVAEVPPPAPPPPEPAPPPLAPAPAQPPQPLTEHDRIVAAIISTATKHNLSPALGIRQAQIESNFNPLARSPRGALGLFQFMPDTAGQYGMDPLDWRQAVQMWGDYLSKLRDYYKGDMAKALAAYNWGMGHVNGDLKQYGDDWRTHVPEETSKYVEKILG